MCFDPVGHIWAVWTDLRPTGIGLTGPWKLGCVRQHQASVPGSAGRGCCLATGLRSSTSRTPSARGLSGECTAWGGIRSVDWQTTCAHFGVHGGACIPWKLDWIRDLALRHPDASQSHGQEPGWALLRHGSGCLQPTLEGLGSRPICFRSQLPGNEHPGGPQVMVQVAGFLPPMQASWTEFLDLGFSLAQLHHSGSEPTDGQCVLCLYRKRNF